MNNTTTDTTADTTETIGPLGRIKYRLGNILSYPAIMIGIYLSANLAIPAGPLILTGGLLIMPRTKRHVTDTPTILGLGMIALGLATIA